MSDVDIRIAVTREDCSATWTDSDHLQHACHWLRHDGVHHRCSCGSETTQATIE